MIDTAQNLAASSASRVAEEVSNWRRANTCKAHIANNIHS